MKIIKYWWGTQLFPDSDKEWDMLVQLFSANNISEEKAFEGGNTIIVDEDCPSFEEYEIEKQWGNRFIEIQR